MQQRILTDFAGLKQAGIVGSRTQLGRLIRNHGFPRGFLLSENRRVWRLVEVEAWLAERETASDASA